VSSIEIFFEDIQPVNYSKKNLNEGIKALINKELMQCGDLSVIFCSDAYLLDMNKQYLDHDYYTDIITFDYVEGKIISGDLFISYDRIVENAKKYQISAEKEMFRVVFHGVLHLVGFKDKSEEEKKLMREKEDYYLKDVNF